MSNNKKDEKEVWRVAYNNYERGTVMNFDGKPIRVLNFKDPRQEIL